MVGVGSVVAEAAGDQAGTVNCEAAPEAGLAELIYRRPVLQWFVAILKLLGSKLVQRERAGPITQRFVGLNRNQHVL